MKKYKVNIFDKPTGRIIPVNHVIAESPKTAREKAFSMLMFDTNRLSMSAKLRDTKLSAVREIS